MRRSSYDLVYSNSVIDHVGNLRAQQQMARVVQKLGTHYFLRTPAKPIPLEPHFYVPFFAYLPLSVRTHLYCRANLGFMGPVRTGCRRGWSAKKPGSCPNVRSKLSFRMLTSSLNRCSD